MRWGHDCVNIDERNEMAAPYTPRQGQFLAYIHAYNRLHRQAPSEMEMATYFGISPPSAHQMVVALQNRGFIERTPGQARSIRVLVAPRDLPDLESGRTPLRPGPPFEQGYPDLASWIMGGGWVELGKTDGVSSMARALDAGGMVWEGKEHYRNIDDLLRELNEGIAQPDRRSACAMSACAHWSGRSGLLPCSPARFARLRSAVGSASGPHGERPQSRTPTASGRHSRPHPHPDRPAESGHGRR